jgi:hypothetical protein
MGPTEGFSIGEGAALGSGSGIKRPRKRRGK